MNTIIRDFSLEIFEELNIEDIIWALFSGTNIQRYS